MITAGRPISALKIAAARAFSVAVHRQDNSLVQLSHLLIKEKDAAAKKPMIVLHGLLGSKTNWRGLMRKESILARRDCYLVEQRNHAMSDHHDDMNYRVLSDDLIRFADKHGLEKFTLLGHSLGGRAAMTTACRFPDRVDGVISVDSAPVDESGQAAFFSFTYGVIEFMAKLKNEGGLSRKEAISRAKEFFKGKPQFVALLQTNMNREVDHLEWLVNIESIHRNF